MMRKEPLYRKVNTKARGLHHGWLKAEYRWERGGKATRQAVADEITRGSMHRKHRHGLDYTPLYRFLLSRVGTDWVAAQSEATARLDRVEPIFRMVALREEDRNPWFAGGESSYFIGLYVDEAGLLAKVAPEIDHTSLMPFCGCCTHTFNGQLFSKPYIADPA